MIESVSKIKDIVFSNDKLTKEQLGLLKVAYEDVCKTHNINSKLDITCSGCVNNAKIIVRNYINEQEVKKEVEIDETKRADGTDKELISDIGSVADNHDLSRSGNFTKEQLEAMNEDEIKLIAKDKGIKIGRSGKEVLIEKILEHGN